MYIANSKGDKFSHWDSQNETLINHYEKKKKKQKQRWIFLILRKSYLTKNISNRTLKFISKWVECVSLKVASHNNEFVKQTLFQKTVCETVVTKIFIF